MFLHMTATNPPSIFYNTILNIHKIILKLQPPEGEMANNSHKQRMYGHNGIDSSSKNYIKKLCPLTLISFIVVPISFFSIT